jgi:hypothetical protein
MRSEKAPEKTLAMAAVASAMPSIKPAVTVLSPMKVIGTPTAGLNALGRDIHQQGDNAEHPNAYQHVLPCHIKKIARQRAPNLCQINTSNMVRTKVVHRELIIFKAAVSLTSSKRHLSKRRD